MAECKKVNIPRVDNTELECEEYYKAECLYITNLSQELREYFNLPETAPMVEVLEKTMEAIKDIRSRLTNLENE